jgi:hypothetical protein
MDHSALRNGGNPRRDVFGSHLHKQGAQGVLDGEHFVEQAGHILGLDPYRGSIWPESCSNADSNVLGLSRATAKISEKKQKKTLLLLNYASHCKGNCHPGRGSRCKGLGECQTVRMTHQTVGWVRVAIRCALLIEDVSNNKAS